jgi:hypothetical protein
MLKKAILLFLLQAIFLKAYCQLDKYYHKIEAVAYHEKSAVNLYKRIDSIKQTRRPNDSHMAVYFDRDVDFGYRQQRIEVTFNSDPYQVNLLTKNDTIYFSSVLFGNSMADNYDIFNKSMCHPKIDTPEAIKYMLLRNHFYGSSKSINDLKDELNLNAEYAYRCGDGLNITARWHEIEALARNNKINDLADLLKNINCEQQQYGVAGFAILKKRGFKISKENQKLINYISKRQSDLVVCNECFTGISRSKH